MGRDKVTVPFGDRALIASTYSVARKVFDRIVILSNSYHSIEGVDAPVLSDILPIRSSMTGIVSALVQTGEPYLFVLACDMPFVTEHSLRAVAGAAHGEDIILPRTAKGYEPLHAVYSRSCISYMLRLIVTEKPQVTRLLPFLAVRVVEELDMQNDGGPFVFTNINTEEDLAAAESLRRTRH